MPKPNRKPPTSARDPRHARVGVDGLAEVDQPESGQHASARDGHSDSEHPHTHPPPVAEVHDVGHRAHGAEVDLVGDGAEHEGEREREPGNEHRQVGHVLRIHSLKLSHAGQPRPGAATVRRWAGRGCGPTSKKEYENVDRHHAQANAGGGIRDHGPRGRRGASAQSPYVGNRLVNVDVYDRVDGTRAAGLSEGRPQLHRRRAGSRVRGAHPQPDRRARAGGHERRRRQRGLGRYRGAVAIGLRARWLGIGRDRRMAQEPVAHRGVLLHRPRRLVRGAHGPAAERGRHRRGGVRGKAEAAHHEPRVRLSRTQGLARRGSGFRGRWNGEARGSAVHAGPAPNRLRARKRRARITPTSSRTRASSARVTGAARSRA